MYLNTIKLLLNLPLMLEQLPNAKEYRLTVEHICSVIKMACAIAKNRIILCLKRLCIFDIVLCRIIAVVDADCFGVSHLDDCGFQGSGKL